MAIQLSYVEKDVEDLLETECARFLRLKFVTRQFRTPVGVIDVLARTSRHFRLYYVIEIKKETLDSDAYVQVLRYTKWLNSEFTKNGKRLFVPLLIGPSLHPDLSTVCEHFGGDHSWFELIGRVFYRLFKFDPLKGVCFDWVNNAQQKHLESLTQNYSHIQCLWERADRLASENYLLRGGLHEVDEGDDEESDSRPLLQLVKDDGEAA